MLQISHIYEHDQGGFPPKTFSKATSDEPRTCERELVIDEHWAVGMAETPALAWLFYFRVSLLRGTRVQVSGTTATCTRSSCLWPALDI